MEDSYPYIRNYMSDVIEGYKSGIINPFTGKQYGLFYYSGGQPFIYNKRHMEEAGIGDEPPRDWNELLDYSHKIQDAGVTEYPLGFFAGSWGFVECAIYCTLMAITEEEPPYLWDEDLNPKFNYKGSALFNGIKAIADAIWTEKVSTTACTQYDEPTTVDTMGSGKHSFIWMPDYELAFINPPGTSAEAGNLKYAISPGPTGRISSIHRTYLVPKVAADKGKEHLDAIWRLMQFTGGKTTDTKPDPNGEYFVVKRIAMQAGLAFPYASMWNDQEILDSMSGWCEPEARRDALAKVYDFFNDPKMTPFWDPWFGYWLAGAVRPKVHSLWLGEQGQPPSDDAILSVLNDVADEWNRMKSEAGM
jgi:multiple sugar transport system substrate-binding protein